MPQAVLILVLSFVIGSLSFWLGSDATTFNHIANAGHFAIIHNIVGGGFAAGIYRVYRELVK